MSNEIKVETIKWEDSPRVKEWKRQHRERTDKALCQHLKKVSVQQVIDNEADTIECHNICEQCGKILSDDDMQRRTEQLKKLKKIQQTLEKFNKLKK